MRYRLCQVVIGKERKLPVAQTFRFETDSIKSKDLSYETS